MIRRKELPTDLQPAFRSFSDVVDAIEPAKAAVADVLPGTRLPGRPLNDALAEYRPGSLAPKPGWARGAARRSRPNGKPASPPLRWRRTGPGPSTATRMTPKASRGFYGRSRA